MIATGYSTFGFEIDNYNSKEYYKRVARLAAPSGLSQDVVESITERVCEVMWKKENTRKLSGYLPIYGIWVGGNRIYDAVCFNPAPDNKISLIVRGIFEILGIGLLLALVDVPIWAYRKCVYLPPNL